MRIESEHHKKKRVYYHVVVFVPDVGEIKVYWAVGGGGEEGKQVMGEALDVSYFGRCCEEVKRGSKTVETAFLLFE